MTKRRPRRPGSSPATERRPRPARASRTISWLIVAGIGLLVLIMVVTSLPLR